MALDDSNPERRNLMVAAICFIAYFYGGGEFIDQTVTLQVVNVKFQRIEVLGGIAWAMYAWFLYRYWLVNGGRFREEFSAELLMGCRDIGLMEHISSEAGECQIEAMDFEVEDESSGKTEALWVPLESLGLVGWRNPGWQPRGFQWFLSSVTLDHRGFTFHVVSTNQIEWVGDTPDLESSAASFSLIFPPRKAETKRLCRSLAWKCLTVRRSFTDYIAPYLLVLVSLGGLLV